MKLRMMLAVFCVFGVIQTGYPIAADAKGGHRGGGHAGKGAKVRARGPGHGRGLGLGRGGGRRGGRAMRRHQRVLNKFDVNHDGVLDQAETTQWQMVKERRRQQKVLMLQNPGAMPQSVKKQKKIK